MRSSGLVVFISANFLPHIIAIPNNSPPGTELIQDPAWGDNSWNINSDNLQEGLSANADGYDLAFANGQPQVTTTEPMDTSLSDLAATPDDCKDHTQPERLRGRAQRLKRDPQKPQVCPLKIEPPDMQPSGESTESNTVPKKQPSRGPIQIPPPWLLVVPEPDWKNTNPNCISKTYGLLTLGVCDSGSYPLPSSFDLHGKPNLAFSQPPTSSDPTSQPTEPGLNLNNAKAWQLTNARLVHPLDTTCGVGSGNNRFWCCKIFTPPVSNKPGKADICLTLDMISHMEANGGFENELSQLTSPR